MAISETISIDAGPGIAALNEFSDAAQAAADKFAETLARFDASFSRLGAGMDVSAAGPDKLVASWDAAAAKIAGIADKINADISRIGSAGASADAGAAGIGKLGEAGETAAAGMDAAAGAAGRLDGSAAGAAASVGRLDDAAASAGGAADEAAAGFARLADAEKAAAEGAAGLAGASGGGADGIKAVGAAAGMSTADLAEFNAVLRETAAIQADTAAISGDAGAKVAFGQKLNTAQMKVSADEAVAAQAAQAKAAKQAAADAEASSAKSHLLLIGGAAAVGYGIDLAAKLQTATTRLYTSAGESKANLAADAQGILALSGETNTSQAQLGQGLYTTNSAGFHGRQGLVVEKAAAEGAQAEGADLPTVTNALTTELNDYFGGPQKSVAAQQHAAVTGMNEIISAVGQGKMTMEGLAGALPTLLPTAKQAGLSLPQVLGAEATMTSQGISTQEGAQEIRHAVGALMKPSNVQSAEMQMLGIDPVQLSSQLGKQGLTGTIAEVDDAIQKHMTKGGMVLVSTMNQSKLATQSANEEIAKLPANLQSVAKGYLAGKVGESQWYGLTGTKSTLPATEVAQLKQFAGLADTAKGFSSLVKSGLGDKQTVAGALSGVMGGQMGQAVSLALGGDHLKTFKGDVDGVGESAKNAGSNIRGWKQVTDTLSFQIGSFTKTAEASATQIGQVALPALTTVLKGANVVGSFLTSHPAIAKPLTEAGGVLGGAYLLGKVASPVTSAVNTVGKVAETLNIPGLDKLANVGKGASSAASGTAAAAGLDKVAGASDAAAAGLSKIGAAGDKAAAGEDAAGAAGSKEAIGESAAGSAGAKEAIGEDAAGAAGAKEAVGESAGGAGGLGGLLGKGLSAALIATMVDQALKGMKNSHGDWLDNAFGTPKTSAWNNWTSFGHEAEHLFDNSAAGKTTEGVKDLFGGGGVTAPPAGRTGGDSPAVYERQNQAAASLPNTPAQQHALSASLMGGAKLPPPPKISAPDTSALETAKSKVQADLKAINQALSTAGAHPGKIPAPDVTALEQAKSKVSADLKGINQALSTASSKPVSIPAPDLSALTAAAGKAGSAAQQITQVMQTALGKPVHAAAPNLSAFTAAIGSARSDGSNISAGLAQGILSEEGAVVAAANQVAAAASSAMAAALKVKSPSEVTTRIGAETSAGLAKGIKSKKTAVKAASMTIAASAVSSLVTGLQGGQSAVDAAMQALGSAAKPQDITTIEQTVTKLTSELDTAKGKKIVSKSEDSALVKWLKGDQSKLEALAAKRTVLETEIGNAQQITQSAVSAASIINAPTATPDSAEPQSAYSIIQGMQYQAQQQQAFAAQAGQLKKSGLNATSLDQIIQSGAASGAPIAQGILSGGPAAIKQLNQLEQQILQSASKLGNTGGPVMYQAGQTLSSMSAKGLKAQLSSVDSQMKSIGNSMVNAVKNAVEGHGKSAMQQAGLSMGQGAAAGLKASEAAVAAAAAAMAEAADKAYKDHLKIKSPSQVFWSYGYASGQGAAGGMDAAGHLVGAASARMAGAAASGYGRAPVVPVMHPGGGSGSGGVTVHNHYSVTVQGNVTAEQDLARTIREINLEHAGNNWQAGMRLPSKAG